MEHTPLPMTQTNTFELEAIEDATRITWTVEWELSGGFSLYKLLLRFSAGSAFEGMIAGSLANLKRLVEEETAAKDAPQVEEAEKSSESGQALSAS